MALSVNVNDPATVPFAVGANFTLTLQVAPAATVDPQVVLDTRKPALATMLLRLSETL